MSMETRSGRKLPLVMQPMAAIVGGCAFVLSGICFILVEHASREMIVQSVVFTMKVMIPFIVFYKWTVHRSIDYYAQGHTHGWRSTSYAQRQRQFNLGVAGFVVLVILSFSHSLLVVGSSFVLLGVLCFICYPEQKAIYHAARAKLAEMNAVASSEGTH